MTDQSFSSIQYSDVTALICPASGDENEPAFAIALGKPILHHQIKMLSQAGIKSVRIYVEHVPGILLSTIDELQASGHDVCAVRSVDELVSTMESRARLLVLQSDLWCDANWLGARLVDTENAVFTLSEQAGNERFERIDLNSRWTGIALCDARILRDLGGMAEGWDLASLLLRRTQQMKLPSIDVAQSDVSSGLLRKLDVSGGIALIENAILGTLEDPNRDMESLMVTPMLRRARGWSEPAHRMHSVANWGALASSALAAGLATFALPVPALIAASLSALFVPARRMLKQISYRRENFDPVDALMGLALVVAVYFCLTHAGESAVDAGFLTLALSGLFGLSKAPDFKRARSEFNVVSLFTVILTLLVGQIVGAIVIVAKILVLVILIFLLVWHHKGSKQP